MTQSPAFGQTIKEQDLTNAFLDSPGQLIVLRTLQQMARVNGYAMLFGPLTVGPVEKGSQVAQAQRWADYQRFDWSIRQLPAINVYEEQTEEKTSSNAWLTGSIAIQVFWPPNFRRSDLARIPNAFKGSLQNFFESDLVKNMLDELYWIQRPEKVPALNEYGKQMTWSPNIEGVIESELVPVTMVSVKYRIDLRAWYRHLEFDSRTKGDPFERTLADLTRIAGEYDGVTGTAATPVEVAVPDSITVSN